MAVLAFAAHPASGTARTTSGAGAFTGAFVESLPLAVVYLLALLGATFLFSSLFKTSTYAVLVVAVMFIFGFSILQDLVAGLVKVEPWFIISYASGGDRLSVPSDLPAHIARWRSDRGGIGVDLDHVQSPTYAEGVSIMLGYFVVTAIARTAPVRAGRVLLGRRAASPARAFGRAPLPVPLSSW